MKQLLTPSLESMPPELRKLNRWVCWRLQDGRKVPFDPKAINSPASSTDPTTWATFEETQTAYLERVGDADAFSGVGIVLNGDGLAGVDIDHCVTDGKPDPAALELLDSLGAAYVEISPSGTGLRAFGYAERLQSGCKGTLNGLDVELYSMGRYLTLTGYTLKAGPIAPLHGFAQLAERIRADRKTDPKTGESVKAAPDEKLEELMRRIRSGDVFHNSLRDLAASLVATGMHPGAVVNLLRALMDASEAPKDERWSARRAQIPDLVNSAVAKFSPSARVDFSGLVDPETGEVFPPLPPAQPNIMAIQDTMSEPLHLEYVVQHILVRGYLYALTANPGAGKTSVSLYMAVMLALGRPFMGRKTKPCKVLFLCGENPQDVRIRTEVMLAQMGVSMDDLHDRIYFTRRPFAIDDPASLRAFVDDALQHGPFELMFIDTGPAHSKADDENDNRAMHELAMAMRDLMEPVGMPCTIALMHPVKGATKDNLLPRGGSAFTGSVDGVLCLWREAIGTPSELFAHSQKFRGRHFEPMFFELAELQHPTALDNFGDPVFTVVARPTEAIGEAADVSALMGGVIREQLLVFLAAIEAEGVWIGTSTAGPAANNPFKKTWADHHAYPPALRHPSAECKQTTYKEIEQMIQDGLLVRERRPTRPSQRERDWPMAIWLTEKGREAIPKKEEIEAVGFEEI